MLHMLMVVVCQTFYKFHKTYHLQLGYSIYFHLSFHLKLNFRFFLYIFIFLAVELEVELEGHGFLDQVGSAVELEVELEGHGFSSNRLADPFAPDSPYDEKQLQLSQSQVCRVQSTTKPCMNRLCVITGGGVKL